MGSSDPEEIIMANTRVTLIVGASGAAASRVMEAAQSDPAFTPIGLTRRDPGAGIPWITADLWDGPALTRAIAARPDIRILSMPPARRMAKLGLRMWPVMSPCYAICWMRRRHRCRAFSICT
jgi:hypothetical protein